MPVVLPFPSFAPPENVVYIPETFAAILTGRLEDGGVERLVIEREGDGTYTWTFDWSEEE